MNRTKGIIIAGSLTGLVLITILALGLGKVGATSNENPALPPTAPELTSPATSSEDIQQEIQAWQKYSQELEQTVRIMQQREAQYQQQLESANQTIIQLQDEVNKTNQIRPRSFFEEEHEGHELGEFDD